MASFSLRRAVPADAPVLSVLAADAFEETFTGTCTEADMDGYLADTYNQGAFTNLLQDASVFICIAFDAAGTAAGYAQWKTDRPPFEVSGTHAVELQRLYVLKPYYGTGLAQQLMDAYEAQAIAAGADLLWLGVWEHNYRAQAFYRKRGFSPTGHSHPFPIGTTPQTDDWWIKPVG
jgi:ribosomal protein S18 acetylase RimI-like enzyme